MPEQHPFLSDEWIAEARKIRAELEGEGGQIPHKVRMNQIITDVPFGPGTIEAHMDTTAGDLTLELGHLPDADVTVTVDYDTAKQIFIDGNPQAGMQAFMEGRIKVSGDLSKLMAMGGGIPMDPRALEVQQRLKAITA